LQQSRQLRLIVIAAALTLAVAWLLWPSAT
jgi:hypothetical protein